MNLSAYDNITEKVDKQRTWINIKDKKLISREIKFRNYNTIIKRYNPQNYNYDYFIALSDNTFNTNVTSKTFVDNYGRIKISLIPIWGDEVIQSYTNDNNVNIIIDDIQEDGEIYKIEF